MLILNLASPEVKKEMKQKQIYILITKICFSLITATVLISIYLLFGQFVINYYYNKSIEESTLLASSYQGYGTRAENLKSELDHINEIQNDFTVFSKVFEELMTMTSNNIKFSSIQISKEDNIIHFLGIASTRQGLLDFKESLEQSDNFDEVNLPIANILEKTNISFDISAKLEI
jgi:hypothetical protein